MHFPLSHTGKALLTRNKVFYNIPSHCVNLEKTQEGIWDLQRALLQKKNREGEAFWPFVLYFCILFRRNNSCHWMCKQKVTGVKWLSHEIPKNRLGPHCAKRKGRSRAYFKIINPLKVTKEGKSINLPAKMQGWNYYPIISLCLPFFFRIKRSET